MFIHKLFVRSVPSLGPVSFRVIRHASNIRTSGYVRLVGRLPASGEEDHIVHVLVHYPLVAVDRKFHEPSKPVLSFDLAQKHEVSDHHQSFDVMKISGLEGFLHGHVDGKHPGGPVVPLLSQAILGFETVPRNQCLS